LGRHWLSCGTHVLPWKGIRLHRVGGLRLLQQFLASGCRFKARCRDVLLLLYATHDILLPHPMGFQGLRFICDFATSGKGSKRCLLPFLCTPSCRGALPLHSLSMGNIGAPPCLLHSSTPMKQGPRTCSQDWTGTGAGDT
jgi:hypothetical protein